MQRSLRRSHLRDARLDLGLTTLDLAESIGLNENQVFNVERGRTRPRYDKAVLWAKRLGMPFSIAFPEFSEKKSGVAR